MRNLAALTALLLPISALQISPASDFLEPYTETHVTILSTNKISIPAELKRQLPGCPAQFNRCTANGYGGACCTQGSFCTTDANRNIACCPNGATCTGTIGGGAANTNSFGAPATTPSATVLPNAYFPFPIIPTTYPGGSAACEQALTACQNNYAACTQILTGGGGGGGFGVTIFAPNGGGVTQAASVNNLAPAQATSVCQSLSQQACHGLTNEAQCAQFGAGDGSFVAGPTGNYAARATAAVGCVAGMVAGLGLGIAGQMM
jgi:hypothetical protein